MIATTPPDWAVYAIGDIHGRHDLLAEMSERIIDDARRRQAAHRQVVYLGDYVSRGIDSRRVINRILTSPLVGFSQVFLKGNHEDSLLRFLEGDFDAARFWFEHDGMDALTHYGVSPLDSGARDDADLARLRERFVAAIPLEHLNFFRSLQCAHRAGGYFFVHAGIRPGVPLERQSAVDCIWMREAFLASNADHGCVVVHGHNITEQPVVRHNRIGIDTGAYRTGTLTCLVLDGATRTFLQT